MHSLLHSLNSLRRLTWSLLEGTFYPDLGGSSGPLLVQPANSLNALRRVDFIECRRHLAKLAPDCSLFLEPLKSSPDGAAVLDSSLPAYCLFARETGPAVMIRVRRQHEINPKLV